MNTLQKTAIVLGICAIFTLNGCDKNPASNNDTVTDELKDSEKMLIIAAELSLPSGGLTADLEIAYDVAIGDIGGLKKTASFDTSFTNSWITYALELSFYAKDGRELPVYVAAITDKVDYNGTLSGANESTGTYQEIELDRHTSLEITGITGTKLTINGTSTNNSEYKLAGAGITMIVKPKSISTFENLKVDLNSSSYIPYSGTIDANIKGKYSKQGLVNDREFDYDFNCVVEFVGDATVKVTLPSGVQFYLDLLTGEFSLVS